MLLTLLTAIATVCFSAGAYAVFTVLTDNIACGILMCIGTAAFGMIHVVKMWASGQMAAMTMNQIFCDEEDDDEPM